MKFTVKLVEQNRNLSTMEKNDSPRNSFEVYAQNILYKTECFQRGNGKNRHDILLSTTGKNRPNVAEKCPKSIKL